MKGGKVEGMSARFSLAHYLVLPRIDRMRLILTP